MIVVDVMKRRQVVGTQIDNISKHLQDACLYDIHSNDQSSCKKLWTRSWCNVYLLWGFKRCIYIYLGHHKVQANVSIAYFKILENATDKFLFI